MENTKHKVTKYWLDQHRTAKGAWTRKQLQALGLTWPPKGNWRSDIEGMMITSEQARQFEDGKTKHAPFKGMKFGKIKKSLEGLKRDQLIALGEYIEQLTKVNK